MWERAWESTANAQLPAQKFTCLPTWLYYLSVSIGTIRLPVYCFIPFSLPLSLCFPNKETERSWARGQRIVTPYYSRWRHFVEQYHLIYLCEWCRWIRMAVLWHSNSKWVPARLFLSFSLVLYRSLSPSLSPLSLHFAPDHIPDCNEKHREPLAVVQSTLSRPSFPSLFHQPRLAGEKKLDWLLP